MLWRLQTDVLSDPLAEGIVTISEKLPLFRSRREAWQGTGRALPEFRPLQAYLRKHPSEIFGADTVMIVSIKAEPLRGNTGFARPLCAFHVRTLHADGSCRHWPIVAKWCAQSDWAREVSAYAVLQKHGEGTDWGSSVVKLFRAIEALNCLLYLRVSGESLQTQWRQAMAGSRRKKQNLWRNLRIAADWLAVFQRRPVHSAELPRTEWNRLVCENARADGPDRFLPKEIDLETLSRWLDKCEAEDLVLCHGDLKLHNVCADGHHLWVFDWEALHLGHRYEDVSAMLMSIMNQCRLFPHRRGLAHKAMHQFTSHYASESHVEANHLLLSIMCRLVELIHWGTGSPRNPIWWGHVRWLKRLLRVLYDWKTRGKVETDDLLCFLRNGTSA